MKFEIFLISCGFILHIASSLGNDSSEDNCQLEFPEELNITELLKLSLSNESCRLQANAQYKSKYGNLTVLVSDGMRENRDIIIDNNRICVGPDILEDFLKAFGPSIESFSIWYFFISGPKHKEIGNWINTYLSETLLELEVKHYTTGGFDDMKKSFKKVERMTFDGFWGDLSENTLSFNELFPEMRVLNLSTGYFSGGHLFGNHYPNLVELNTHVESSEDLMKLLEKNSQLKKLRLVKTTMKLLHTVNDKLPNLLFLGFNMPQDLYSYKGPNITFEHIRAAAVRDFSYNMRSSKIAFKKLYQLELAIAGKLDDKWIDFIGANKELKLLFISDGDLNNATLDKLSSKLNSLVEAEVRCDPSVSVKTIESFLQNNPLMKITILNFANGTLKFLNDFTDLLKSEWSVVSMNENMNRICITKIDSSSIENQTENVQNTTTLETNSDSSAAHLFSSMFLTATVMIIVINVITSF